MQVQGVSSWFRSEKAAAADPYRKLLEDEISSAPMSWGADTVTISNEARAAQQSAAAQTADDEGAPAAEKSSPGEDFAAYMEKARGDVSSSGASAEEQLEALQKKLEDLQNKMQQTASAPLPEETKQSQIQSLNTQISTIMAQISELTASAAKSKA